MIQDTSQTITLAYQKPGLAKVTVADKSGLLAEIVSNGENITLFSAYDKEYRIQTIPEGANRIRTVFSQSHTLLAQVIAPPTIFLTLITEPGVTATLGTPDTVNGVTTDTVYAALRPHDGGKMHYVLAFGKDDHLLRRVVQTETLTQAGHTKILSDIETVTALSALPPLTAADFVFIPPSDAKQAPTTPSAPTVQARPTKSP